MTETLPPSSNIPENTTNPVINLKPSPRSTSLKTALIILFLLLILLATGYFIYSQGYFIQLVNKPSSFTPPIPTSIPTPLPISTSSETIENCRMTKKSDAIVEAVGKVDEKTVGIFWGNIQDIQINNGSIALTLISVDGKQLYLFKFTDREQLFYDTQKLKYLKSSEVIIGNTLFMSFECNPNAADKKPYFTRIAVTGKVFGNI